MKVAVIGTGISGLAAAHRLKDRSDLTVFEAERRTGGHANTVVVESERGFESVDTGFIVFNDRNYPEFTRILEQMEVASRPSSMSFSYTDGQFEYAGRDLRSLFAQRSNIVRPSFIRMLAEFTRFQRLLRRMVADGETGPSLDDFLARHGFAPELMERVVIPLVASVWSADPGQMSSFPVGFLARFLDDHGLLSLRGRPAWRTVEGGSWQYVEALTAPIRPSVRTGTPIERLVRFEDHVEVVPKGGPPERFDEVVIATHSDQALRMLADPSELERELLGSIAYQPNHTILHTDESVMPERRAAWACWNYRQTGDRSNRATVTYDMNRLQTLSCRRRFFVSLNLEHLIDPESVLARFEYEHPVFTPETVAAQERWSEISGVRRTHFCGAYWRNGLHEDGAFSGIRAARAVEARIEEGGTGRAGEVPSEWA